MANSRTSLSQPQIEALLASLAPQVCTGSDGLGFSRRGGLSVGINLNPGPLKTLLGKGDTTMKTTRVSRRLL